MERTKYHIRHIAKVILEATTPIAISSGIKDILTDAPVLIDANGLPYIPGTSLAGVIRHGVSQECQIIFGRKGTSSNDCRGSEIIFSDGKLIGPDGEVIDGLNSTIDWHNPFYAMFKDLPIRQHVKINAKGVADKMGKFDHQVVYKGTRFCFEIEFLTDGSNEELFKQIITKLYDEATRFGSGTRRGFGKLSVVSVALRRYELFNPGDLAAYLNKSSRLTVIKQSDTCAQMPDTSISYRKYRLSLKPNDFFCFSSGFSNGKADITPVKEYSIEWCDDKPRFVEASVVIPATSLKGAISHRTAYHWNRLNKRIADTDLSPLSGDNNPAVVALFGTAVAAHASRGKVIFSDIIVKDNSFDKILNHVSIDRFTGGSIDGALFNEQTIFANGATYTTTILVDDSEIHDPTIIEAFEQTLKDICLGTLPLGGGINRGNGIFKGEFECVLQHI